MKTCTKCGETKPVSEFSKDSGRRSGLQYSCKSCDRIKRAIYYAASQDKAKAWRAANPEKVKAIYAKHIAKNPGRWIAYRAANPEKTKAFYAAWAKANPEAVRIKSHNRRARKFKAGGKLSKGLAERLFKLQRGKCACGCKQPLGIDYHLDHRMPLALGGSNTDDNIQLLRAICNLQKNAKHPIEFMQQRGFLL